MKFPSKELIKTLAFAHDIILTENATEINNEMIRFETTTHNNKGIYYMAKTKMIFVWTQSVGSKSRYVWQYDETGILLHETRNTYGGGQVQTQIIRCHDVEKHH